MNNIPSLLFRDLTLDEFNQYANTPYFYDFVKDSFDELDDLLATAFLLGIFMIIPTAIFIIIGFMTEVFYCYKSHKFYTKYPEEFI